MGAQLKSKELLSNLTPMWLSVAVVALLPEQPVLTQPGHRSSACLSDSADTKHTELVGTFQKGVLSHCV